MKPIEFNGKESEFAATIAAAAYAIHSLEETRAEYERLMTESFREQPPPTRTKSTNSYQDNDTKNNDNNTFELPNLGRVLTRQSAQREKRDDGKGSMRSSTRPIDISGPKQRVGSGKVKTEADAWERARIAKINKWYEKMSGKILEWENEKKKKAGLDMERRKAELERLKRVNLHHYQNKIDWIENVSGGARKQLEEKKTSEEAQAKEKAKRIRSTGRVPVQCFCFEY